jgi:hypothetical protein
MKYAVPFLRRLFLTAFAAALPAALSAADTFEGRIHIEMTDAKKQTQAIDYAIKDGKIRFDTPADKNGHSSGAGGIIIDFPQNEMIILMDHDGQKNFMRRPMAQPGAAPASHPAAGGMASAPPVVTGRTGTIAGYPATEYTATGEKGETVELWLAQGLGNFMFPAGGNPMARGGSAPAAPGWEKIARDGGFFPLRAVVRDKSGAEKSRFEVTKIERTSLPESLFSTDGYSEFKIPGFGSMNPFAH